MGGSNPLLRRYVCILRYENPSIELYSSFQLKKFLLFILFIHCIPHPHPLNLQNQSQTTHPHLLSSPPFLKNPQIASADIPTQARLTAASVAQNITTGTKGAAEQFQKLLDDGGGGSGPSRSKSSGPSSSRAVEPDRRDFWDSFGKGEGVGGKEERGKGSAIGTAAMRKGGGGGAGGGGGKEDGWDEW